MTGCEAGFYGSDCASLCQCEMDTTEVCDFEDGTCYCKPGYAGDLCESGMSFSNFTRINSYMLWDI